MDEQFIEKLFAEKTRISEDKGRVTSEILKSSTDPSIGIMLDNLFRLEDARRNNAEHITLALNPPKKPFWKVIFRK